MPPRSNDFQRLVFLVKKLLSEAATVTESKALTDRLTGDQREVDVCIEAEVGGHPVMICFECRDHKRRADVIWVEQMKAKHERLPTSELVLVSRSGFSRRAWSLAKVAGIQLLSYTSLTEQEVGKAVDLTESLWAVTYQLNVTKVRGVAAAVGELEAETVTFMRDNTCFDAQGRQAGTIEELVARVLKDQLVVEYFMREGTESHRFFTVEGGTPRLASGEPAFVEKMEPRTLRALEHLDIRGTFRLARARFQMTHGSLGPVRVAWGASVLDGKDAMLLALKKDGADVILTLHLEPKT